MEVCDRVIVIPRTSLLSCRFLLVAPFPLSQGSHTKGLPSKRQRAQSGLSVNSQ